MTAFKNKVNQASESDLAKKAGIFFINLYAYEFLYKMHIKIILYVIRKIEWKHRQDCPRKWDKNWSVWSCEVIFKYSWSHLSTNRKWTVIKFSSEFFLLYFFFLNISIIKIFLGLQSTESFKETVRLG